MNFAIKYEKYCHFIINMIYWIRKSEGGKIMSFIEQIKERAKTETKTIVLPEATDQRILEAAQIVKNDGYAKVILIGNEDEVKKIANDKKIDIEGIKIVDPSKSEKKE